MRRKGRGRGSRGRGFDPPMHENTYKEPRANFYQPVPDIYTATHGEAENKSFNKVEILQEAKKVGEIATAQGIKFDDLRKDYLEAKATIESQKTPAPAQNYQAQAPPQTKAPTPQTQEQSQVAAPSKFAQFVKEQKESFVKGAQQLSQNTKDFFKANSRDSPTKQDIEKSQSANKDQTKDQTKEKNKDYKER